MATTAATTDATLTMPAFAPAKVGLLPILMAVLLSTFVALGAVGGGAWWLLRSGKLNLGGAAGAAAASSAHVTKPEAEASAVLPLSHVLALDPMVVNLSDAGGRSFLRASISLRLAKDAKPKGEKEEPAKGDKADAGASAALRDTTLGVLGAQTSDMLLAAGGLDALKKKLRASYALKNTDMHVLEVYVTDFLVQRG